MNSSKVLNKNVFLEDYTNQMKAASDEDAEDALTELCGLIEPFDDGTHWLECPDNLTVDEKTVFFRFTADASTNGLGLTYQGWSYSY